MKCKNGIHDLIVILTTIWDYVGDVKAVVRWCRYCGAVVVDGDKDGRTAPGRIVKMKFPEIIKNKGE